MVTPQHKSKSLDYQGKVIIDFNPELKLTSLFCSGYMSYELFCEKLLSITGTADHKPTFSLLIDMSDITYHFAYEEVIGIKDQLVALKKHFPSKIALVTTGLFNSLGKLISIFAAREGLNIESFSSAEMAMKWIKADST